MIIPKNFNASVMAASFSGGLLAVWNSQISVCRNSRSITVFLYDLGNIKMVYIQLDLDMLLRVEFVQKTLCISA